MRKDGPADFHKLYGVKKPRAVYYKRDFLDYVVMVLLSALAVMSYGPGHILSIIGLGLCVFMIVMFAVRHGVEFRVPVCVSRPQEVFYMFVYKLQNLGWVYFAALGLLLLENLLIAATPTLPHHVEWMRKAGLWLFYIHFLSITLFRTAILIDHLAKKELVREVLMQTPWQRVIKDQTNITLEILHAYCTGILTHIIMIAPWYLVIRYARFSVVFLPAVCLINLFVNLKWLQGYNAWFYRDHWLGHNSELDFIFLHGTHHDALPSGLIAVADNGFLEGFLRFTLGWPVPFYNPFISFLVSMYLVKIDIELHQYIPGVFPRISTEFMEVFQHSTHHYGPIEPYSIGAKIDQPGISEEYRKSLQWIPDGIRNSARLDEELTGFQWNNPTHRRTLSLWDKYQNRQRTNRVNESL